jgi:hypothetical protein
MDKTDSPVQSGAGRLLERMVVLARLSDCMGWIYPAYLDRCRPSLNRLRQPVL